MIPFASADKFGQLPPQRHNVVALSDDQFDWNYLDGIIGKLPSRFVGPVADRYRYRKGNEGQYQANRWIAEVGQTVTVRGAALAASDDEIAAEAKRCADTVSGILNDTGNDRGHFAGVTTEAVIGRLSDYARSQGVEPPKCECAGSLRGMVARMTDAAWWRRQFRRQIARKVEAFAIDMGQVHRRAGMYASDETCERHASQQRRNADALESTQAVNEAGQVFTLAELAEVGVSNPAIRRAELMTRIRGFEAWAQEAGHVGRFYTWTCPSRMHARLSKSGDVNPKYDGTTPKEAATFLGKLWAKARAWMGRRGLFPYGFRVAEPHHDGTPHWHLLLFMPAAVADTVTGCMQRYAMEPDAHELTSASAISARFKVVAIDWERGSAAGYIAKYVCKNIDGRKTTGEAVEFDKPEGDDFKGGAVEGAARVRAWASCWGIRQFQQIGGPGVTVWRELRKVREAEGVQGVQGELFEGWQAADRGLWQSFIRIQGGIEIRRNDRPLQLEKEDTGELNRYAEPKGPEVVGVFCCKPTAGASYMHTRRHQWQIIRAADKGAAKRVFNIRGAANGREAEAHGATAGKCREGIEPIGRIEKGAESGEGGFSRVQLRRKNRVGGFDLGRASGPWTRVNNCTHDTRKRGLAANLAGWAIAAPPNQDHIVGAIAPPMSGKQIVSMIFDQLRRLKGGAY